MRSLFACALLLLFGPVTGHSKTISGRYLYVVTCDARVDKVDTASRKTASSDLAKNAGAEHPIPVVTGTLDGCLTYQAIYDQAASVFYTVAAVQAQPKADGTKDYRVLGFSVPGMRLIKNTSGGEDLEDAPHLEMTLGHEAQVVKSAEWTPQSQLDLSPFGPEHKPVPHQILETSGDHALLRIFTADLAQLRFAVANKRTKTVVTLLDVPATVAPGVHLTPGGLFVLVEGTEGTAKNGQLTVYDAQSGKRVKTLFDRHIKDLQFLAVSPNGKAIYHSKNSYWLVDLGVAFSGDAVSRPVAAGYPGFFFADR